VWIQDAQSIFFLLSTNCRLNEDAGVQIEIIDVIPSKNMILVIEIRAERQVLCGLLEESNALFRAVDTEATFERLFLSWRKFPLPPEKKRKWINEGNNR
jgi:hypothetical protein